MTISVSPSEFNANVAMRTFLQSILPEDVDVIRGQANRVPEPAKPDFIVMTPTRRTRLATNVDEFVDTRFIGAISDVALTVTEMDYGGLKVGSIILGVGIAPRTSITRINPGTTGGVGGYMVSKPQTVASEVMAAGVLNAAQPTELTIQLDVHGPQSADFAQRIVTMMHDEYAWINFTRQGLGVLPLRAEDAKQVPFINAEQQYEDRWIVEACLQIHATVNDIPQEFFEQVIVGLIDVDAKYPP